MPDGMDEPRRQPAASTTALREHMATERTLLAFWRTPIGLITLGTSINRFSQCWITKRRRGIRR